MKNGEMLPYFLATYAASFWGRTYFLSCSKQTTNLASINSTQLKEMPLPVPPLPEQQKIAAILSTWDRAIELTEKLIAASQKRKQALMQQLLTGKVRFKEFEGKPWRKAKLGNLLTVRNEQIENVGTHPLYSLTIENGVTPKTDRYDREALVRDKAAKKYKVVKPGDIVFNPSNLRWGAIGIHYGVVPVLVSPIYEVLYVTKVDATDNGFLFQQLSSSRQIELFSGMAEGTLIERTAVKLPTFLACEVVMPPTRDEQQRVACVLAAADHEIDALVRRKVSLTKQKKGLMQLLLTGKVRVKVDTGKPMKGIVQ
jgi:type I restriction enzyme S subunit